MEGETLPQFFRHNRFQSLVRQLNFYSFRKINRERNVWIYKHALFHRDRPEDLYRVRRRTCPGMDGRKQRFSRYSARKLQEGDVSDDDDSLEEDTSLASRKRESESVAGTYMTKRSRRSSDASTKATKEVVTSIDTSMLVPVSETSSVAEDDPVTTKRNNRKVAAEQSHIVSEVAMKLEEYARKVLKGRGGSGRAGVVTPPYGSSSFSASLITYDDEYPLEFNSMYSRQSSLSLGVVSSSDVDEYSMASAEMGAPAIITPIKERSTVEPPVENLFDVDRLVSLIMECGPMGRPVLLGPAMLTRFCMSTSPSIDNEDLICKIDELLSTCPPLAKEFFLYRSALRADATEVISAGHSLAATYNTDAKRDEFLRDFKTFSVNSLRRINGEAFGALSETDMGIMERTASAWASVA